jgi:hypothetical protein
MEHQTAKDTTIDESEPFGQRGAYVADTVGYSVDEKEGAGRH